MRQLGQSEAHIEQELAKYRASIGATADETIELSPDEARAVTLFLAMGTQWIWAGMGERVGLDYGKIKDTAELHEIALEPRGPLMINLRVMEDEALAVWAEQRKAG